LTISLIVAMTENGVIGDNNQLLWHLPNDLKHFKATTLGKPIIMGRKTYDSIGRPLPGRQNIVLTRDKSLMLAGCDVVHTTDAVAQCIPSQTEMMVIGGETIYRQFYDKAQTLYLTLVHTTMTGDASFTYNPQEWQETSRETHAQDEKHAFDYSFITYQRK